MRILLHKRDPASLPDSGQNGLFTVDYFSPPYPNREILIVNAVGVPGLIVLMQVHAYLGL